MVKVKNYNKYWGNNKKIKVFFLTKETCGGTGSLLKQFLKLNNRIFFKKFFSFKTTPSSILNKKILFINKYYPTDVRPTFTKIILLIKNLFFTYRLINKQKPDVIFLTDLYPSIIVLFLKIIRFKELKTIVLININLKFLIQERPFFWYRQILLSVIKNFYKVSNLIVFVSKIQRQDLTNFFSWRTVKTTYIYNGVNLRVKPRIDRNNKTPKLITIARFNKQKDFDTLFRGLIILKKQMPKISLSILGSGELRQQIKAKIKDLQLNKIIKIFPWKEDVIPTLRKHDVFVLSSFYEGFPRAILEAMSVGLPVVATNCQYGPAEIIGNNKYGILIPVGNPQAIVEAVFTLLTNRKKYQYYSQKSLERAQYFSVEKMLKTYEKKILEVVSR